MLIKRFSSNRFAGLKEIDVEFSEGLNVMLGPNESGKSTIVEGIYATLFKAPALRMSVKADKLFRDRFMPHPDGDAIDGEIILCVKGKEYRLKKEWGAEESLQLLTPEGNIIKDKTAVTKAINELLRFGPGTYSSVVFAKQRDIKRALGKILSDNTSREVSKILMKAMMELDGVSVDELGERILKEKERLLKRWDLDRNCPINNRGVHNPYKTGLGEVLKAFYKKEKIKLFMDGIHRKEAEFERICEHLKKEEIQNRELKLKMDGLSAIESDMVQRSILEPRIEGLEKEKTILTEICKGWPAKESLIKDYKKELKITTAKLEILAKEKEVLQKNKRRTQLGKRLETIEGLTKKAHGIRDRIKQIKDITDGDIKNLENLREELLKINAAMEAGVMTGKFKKLDKTLDIFVTTDLKVKQKAKEEGVFTAKGYIRIESDRFELELKTGELDYGKLKGEYKKYDSKLTELLKDLQVSSIEQGKLNREELLKLRAEEQNMKRQVKLLLGDEDYEGLKKELQQLNNLGEARNLEEIDRDIKNLQNVQMDCRVKKLKEENALTEWAEEYKNQDNVFEILIEKGAELKKLQGELGKLAPIPEGFKSAQDFRDTLSGIRDAYEEGRKRHSILKDKYYQHQRDLPDSTYEEIKAEYEEGVSTFEKKVNRAHKLVKINKAFEGIKEEIGREPFKPLTEKFTKYLYLLTGGNYEQGQIDGDFGIYLQNKEGIDIPPLLLSAGTHDCVALALRLSILHYIYGASKGYVILDDCIVDLDPERRKMAAQLIKQYAKHNQVIFTTCDPEIAKLLGGNVIKI